MLGVVWCGVCVCIINRVCMCVCVFTLPINLFPCLHNGSFIAWHCTSFLSCYLLSYPVYRAPSGTGQHSEIAWRQFATHMVGDTWQLG